MQAEKTRSVYVPRSYSGSVKSHSVVRVRVRWNGHTVGRDQESLVPKSLPTLTLSLARDLLRVSRTSYSEHLACITTCWAAPLIDTLMMFPRAIANFD
jgi:hypothetical protein